MRGFSRRSLSWIFFGLLLIVFSCGLIEARRGGGGGGGRGGGGSRISSSSSSRSSWGSSSSSSSSSSRYSGSSTGLGRSSSSSSHSTRWGSSSSTGGSGYSSSSRYAARPGVSGSRAPSSTYARVSSGSSAARASAGVARSRPQASVPKPAQSQTINVQYHNTYVNYGRSGLGGSSWMSTGLSMMGGYYLGRMMGRMAFGPYGYGCGYYHCGYYNDYVPYRARYGQYYMTTVPPATIGQTAPAAATTQPPKREVDLCTLARWNRELQFSELPNMMLEFLANDTVSGTTTAEKAQFIFNISKSSAESYKLYNSTADIFVIPPQQDLGKCNFQLSGDFDPTQPKASSDAPEEPVLTALRNLVNIYSNKSSNTDDIRDVQLAAKECLPRGGQVKSPEVLPCLDFALNPDQLFMLEHPASLFGNEEICRRFLNPDVFKCVPSSSGSSTCTVENLVALNVFARNFYLCPEEIDKDRAASLRQDFDSRYQLEGSSSALVVSVLGLLAPLMVALVLPL